MKPIDLKTIVELHVNQMGIQLFNKILLYFYITCRYKNKNKNFLYRV